MIHATIHEDGTATDATGTPYAERYEVQQLLIKIAPLLTNAYHRPVLDGWAYHVQEFYDKDFLRESFASISRIGYAPTRWHTQVCLELGLVEQVSLPLGEEQVLNFLRLTQVGYDVNALLMRAQFEEAFSEQLLETLLTLSRDHQAREFGAAIAQGGSLDYADTWEEALTAMMDLTAPVQTYLPTCYANDHALLVKIFLAQQAGLAS